MPNGDLDITEHGAELEVSKVEIDRRVVAQSRGSTSIEPRATKDSTLFLPATSVSESARLKNRHALEMKLKDGKFATVSETRSLKSESLRSSESTGRNNVRRSRTGSIHSSASSKSSKSKSTSPTRSSAKQNISTLKRESSFDGNITTISGANSLKSSSPKGSPRASSNKKKLSNFQRESCFNDNLDTMSGTNSTKSTSPTESPKGNYNKKTISNPHGKRSCNPNLEITSRQEERRTSDVQWKRNSEGRESNNSRLTMTGGVVYNSSSSYDEESAIENKACNTSTGRTESQKVQEDALSKAWTGRERKLAFCATFVTCALVVLVLVSVLSFVVFHASNLGSSSSSSKGSLTSSSNANGNNNNNNFGPSLPPQKQANTPLNPNDVVATVPETICNEWIPGQNNNSSTCSSPATGTQGGGVGNLIAMAWRSVTHADIAILNAGICKDDILAPQLTVAGLHEVLNLDTLVLLAISGDSIKALLEQAVDSALGASNQDEGSAYPYASGLRFSVDVNGNPGNRVYNIQVKSPYSNALVPWVPMDTGKYFNVVTTSSLANGGDGYKQFTTVINQWRKDLATMTTIDAFYTYASNVGQLTNPSPADFSTQTFLAQGAYEPVIANVPHDICLEWTPGSGKSKICTPQQTVHQGGGVCNLVAWALLDQVWSAEIAIVRSGDVATDIRHGEFTDRDAYIMLPDNLPLVTIQLSGFQIHSLLEQALAGALGSGTNRIESYPYAGGLRYSVTKFADASGNRAYGLEYFQNFNWVPLQDAGQYTVVTTINLLSGNVTDYTDLHDYSVQEPSLVHPLQQACADAFIEYAKEWSVLDDPPRDKYSTQQFT